MTKETNIPPFMEEGLNSFKKFKFPGADMGNLISIYQKNMELMNVTQQIAVETTHSVLELQRQYMKTALDQWNNHINSCCSKAPLEEKTAHQAEVAKTAADQIVAHTKALHSIIAKSNEKINETVQKGLKEGIDEFSNVVKKGKETR
jgi:phasin family protein